MNLRHTVQEIRELGARGTLFRVGWELRMRTGAKRRLERALPPFPGAPDDAGVTRMPFAEPAAVVAAVRPRVAPADVEGLLRVAADDAAGRVLCFGRDVYDFGDPVDWYLHPWSRRRWDARRHWTEALAGVGEIGDPKLTWEPARFPQAYRVARAAAFAPDQAYALYRALLAQVEGFLDASPHPDGLHWFSSQEFEIRVVAWAFAARVFRGLGLDVRALTDRVARHAWDAAHHTERELEYAKEAVYNNHLIAEALGLYVFSTLVPDGADARRWRATGLALLDEQADRQFYRDGAYLNLAHNYHRTVLHDYLLASRMVQREGAAIPAPWRRALERSLDFLVAQQNPGDGRLPNYGSNDGSMPRVLSTCAFSDFRPTLQAVSLATRGERLYPPGPWDEEAAWLLGPDALEAPLREPARRSASFAHTGFHVLRARDAPTFSVLRCGTVRDRFGQIDMLHLDAWWRGQNVLVDAGTWLYNGPREGLEHFLRTASHNTVTVDGRDQMLHWRQFKFLYWTRATTLRFEDRGRFAAVAGEHEGYARHPGGCVHRRSVLLAKGDVDALWVVADRVSGVGRHTARLHWLAGPYAHAYDAGRASLTLDTPAGAFEVRTFDASGAALAGDVVRGREDPPRGWLARFYAHREPVPSLAVEREGDGEIEFVTVMGAGPVNVVREGDAWRAEAGGVSVRFRVRDGLVEPMNDR